jgi:hypothetical protein
MKIYTNLFKNMAIPFLLTPKKKGGRTLFTNPRLIEDWSRDDAIIKVVFGSTVKHKNSAPKDAEQNR